MTELISEDKKEHEGKQWEKVEWGGHFGQRKEGVPFPYQTRPNHGLPGQFSLLNITLCLPFSISTATSSTFY